MVAAIAATAVTVAASAASSAMQASAAKKAAKGQQQSADEAIALQREQWQQGREDIAPWRQAGVRALGQFEALARQGPPQFDRFQGPEALAPGQFAFKPPTAADMMQDPGYQFRLQQGSQALERSAAARGGLLSGGFARNAQEYGQNMASQEYGQVYGRRMGENQLRYGRALAQNQSAYERALQRYTTNYNSGMGQWQARLTPWQTLAGGGQTASNNLATLGGNYASQVGSILAANANAQAGSQMAQANAWGNFATNTANALGDAYGMWSWQRNNPASTIPPQDDIAV